MRSPVAGGTRPGTRWNLLIAVVAMACVLGWLCLRGESAGDDTRLPSRSVGAASDGAGVAAAADLASRAVAGAAAEPAASVIPVTPYSRPAPTEYGLRVVDETAAPIRGAVAYWAAKHARTAAPTARFVTDADGRTRVPAGTDNLRLVVWEKDHALGVVEALVADEVNEVVLRRRYHYRATFKDPAGQPVRDVSVTVSRIAVGWAADLAAEGTDLMPGPVVRPQVRSAVSDGAGVVELGGLDDASWSVSVSHPDCAPTNIAASRSVTLGADLTEEFIMSPLLAALANFAPPDDDILGWERTVRSSADPMDSKRQTLDMLAHRLAQEHSARVCFVVFGPVNAADGSPIDAPQETITVTLASGGTQKVAVRLRPLREAVKPDILTLSDAGRGGGGTLVVDVVGDLGEPVSGVPLSLHGAAGGPMGLHAVSGAAKLLPAGRYDAHPWFPRDPARLVPSVTAEVVNGATTHAVIRLPPGTTQLQFVTHAAVADVSGALSFEITRDGRELRLGDGHEPTFVSTGTYELTWGSTVFKWGARPLVIPESNTANDILKVDIDLELP